MLYCETPAPPQAYHLTPTADDTRREDIVSDIDIPHLRPDAMSVDDAVTIFADTTDTLPIIPLVWCLANWQQAGPHLLAIIERYADGSDRSDKATGATLYCIFLAAAAREKQAFVALCRLARDEAAMEEALGDSVTESFQNILISTFDGNLDLLKGVIEDDGVDEFIAAAALQAFAYLAAAGDIDRPEAESYLTGLSAKSTWVPGSFAWSEWANVVALLGLEQCKPMIKSAIDDKRIDLHVSDFSYYERTFEMASGQDDPRTIFHDNNIRIITDIAAEFDGWYSFSEQRRRDDQERAKRAQNSYNLFDSPIPASNPFRSVGRNDPCPCGSGKKFKKCCLT